MIKCPICGKECEDGTVFCPGCGTKLEHRDTAPTGEAVTHTAGGDTKPLGMWDYFLMDIVAKIPVVRLILFLVWGFSSDSNENRRNWSRAKLIWVAVGIVFSLLGVALFAVCGTVLYDTVRGAFSAIM